ncbi:MAG TPA: ABC transporter substrate-binding protein [Thermomicrobiales bacterium]|nr:ABC transporter substrate-binding protein [Thermomicrobiales bacterium]
MTHPDNDLLRALHTRRSVAKSALGLSLGTHAAMLARTGSAHQGASPAASPLASPAASPVASPVAIGEDLDLGNLSPGIPEPSAPVTITFASWVGSSPVLQSLRDQFQQLHPNITVNFEDVPAEEFTDRLTTRIAGGNPPDVAFLDQSAVVDFASRNALLELGPYAEQSAAVKVDDYVDAFLNAAIYEEKLYGLPFDGESTGLFYRTDLFETAGIAGPPTTWEEFEAAAQALTNAENRTYGTILFATEAAYYWYPWLWQNGGELLSEDGTQILFNSDEGKEAAEFYVGLAEYSPADYLNSNSYDGRIAFAEGQVAMYIAGAWFAGVMMSEFPDITGKWAAAPLPERVRCATTVAGDTLVIPSASANHDASWKWIEFLSAPQNLALWTLGTPENPSTLLPTRTSLLENPAIFENNPILKGFAEQMACGVTNAAPNPRYGEVESLLNDALGRAIYGETDAATALDEAAEEGQAILDEG